jgi:hypothetical protein
MPSGDTTRKRTGPGRPVIQTRRESRNLADTLSITATGGPIEVTMHIVDGALSNPGVIGGAVRTVAGNAPAMALPAIAVHDLCRSGIGSERVRVPGVRGGLAGGWPSS